MAPKCQSACEFWPFLPTPLPAIDEALIPGFLPQSEISSPQPPSRPFPLPCHRSQPSLSPSSFLLLSLPPFFPPFLPSLHLPLPSHPLPLFCTTCVKHLGNTVAAKTDPRASISVGRQPVVSLLFLGHSLNSDSWTFSLLISKPPGIKASFISILISYSFLLPLPTGPAIKCNSVIYVFRLLLGTAYIEFTRT